MSIRRSLAGGLSLVVLTLASGCGSLGSSSTSSSRGGLFSRMSASRNAADCNCSTPSGGPVGIMTSGPSMTRDTPFPGIPIVNGPMGGPSLGTPGPMNVLPNPMPIPRGGISESGEAPRKEDPGASKMSTPKISSPK